MCTNHQHYHHPYLLEMGFRLFFPIVLPSCLSIFHSYFPLLLCLLYPISSNLLYKIFFWHKKNIKLYITHQAFLSLFLKSFNWLVSHSLTVTSWVHNFESLIFLFFHFHSFIFVRSSSLLPIFSLLLLLLPVPTHRCVTWLLLNPLAIFELLLHVCLYNSNFMN